MMEGGTPFAGDIHNQSGNTIGPEGRGRGGVIKPFRNVIKRYWTEEEVIANFAH